MGNVTSNVQMPTCSSSINAFGSFGAGGGVHPQPEKNHRFYRGHLNGGGGREKKTVFAFFLLTVWRATPASIRLKGVLLMLHLSLPIVNSVAPFPP